LKYRGVTNITGARDEWYMAKRHSGVFLITSYKIQFCREAEMKDLTKKCWREKVTAEITLSHLQHFVAESGSRMSAAEVAAFLNQDGRAQDMWVHMMQAGEEYIKSMLEQKVVGLHAVKQAPTHATLLQ
jgi:hypothetical protein